MGSWKPGSELGQKIPQLNPGAVRISTLQKASIYHPPCPRRKSILEHGLLALKEFSKFISAFGINRTGVKKPASAINRVYSLVKWGPGDLS